MKVKGNALRPDGQAFDEVRIITVPRWKESELSGDEWRISAEIQLYRNGNLIHTRRTSRVETACGFAYAEYMIAQDEAKGYFASEEDFCDQEGCKEKATTFLKKKFDWNNEGDKKPCSHEQIRQFCDKHKRRGDCGLDDADNNYDVVVNQ